MAEAKATEQLHRDAIVIDGQGVGVLMPVMLTPQPDHDGVSFIDRALKAGVTAINTSMGIGGVASGRDDFRGLIESIHGNLVHFELEPDRLVHVETADDIVAAKQQGKLGVIFGVQGLAAKIDNDINLLRVLRKLGLRVAQLTQNDRNSFGCGCLEPIDSGLTQLGRACVAEMNHLRIVVDMAHAGERTAIEGLEASTRPAIVSHANARALASSPRNATNAMLDAVKASNGVIGITAYSPFCETERGRQPTLESFVDHMAYVVDRIGVDHVGIGSDFFDAESPVRFDAHARHYPDVVRGYTLETIYCEDFKRVDHLPRLTGALLRRGFTEADILKVLGGNFLRVFREVWGG